MSKYPPSLDSKIFQGAAGKGGGLFGTPPFFGQNFPDFLGFLGSFFQNFRRLRRPFLCFLSACGAIFHIFLDTCGTTIPLSSSSRWYAHIFQRSFMALVLPMVLVKIERTGIKQTGHNLLHSTQVRLNQSSLVATFPSASFLLCLICAVFSSAAPAALHFTTIFP